MSDILTLNNKMQENKDNEILQMMNNTSIYPMLKESEVGVSNYTSLPLSRLAAYGTAFQPLTTAVQTAVNGAGGSGIYYVNTCTSVNPPSVRRNISKI